LGRWWVHVALAVTSRFIVDLRLGPRTLETAEQLLASVALCCRDTSRLPLLLLDNHLPYPAAILRAFGVVRHRRRKRGRGRRKHPDLKPPPGLLAGVVHKVRDATGNLLRVRGKALFGRKRDIIQRIKQLKLGQQINTAHIERLNGTMRGQQSRLARRTRAGSRRGRTLAWSLALWRDLYNWVWPHTSLLGRTPAMALGLTDARWSVLRYVEHPVHVSDLQRAMWAEDRQNQLTSALDARKRKKLLPTS
jgi:IS1 family transposase